MNAPYGLDRAVLPALVRIGPVDDGYDRLSGRGPAFWGSGFFVAPGWVLTCAHVVGKGGAGVWRGERAIGITIESGEVLTGELGFGLPAPEDPEVPPQSWPLPDLALVRVPDAADPDCLWLTDRSTCAPAEVALYGWVPGPTKDEPILFQGGGNATGGSPHGGSVTSLYLSGGQLTEGCSGGPVIDVGQGAVIAVSKSKGRGGGAGLATPVTELRRLCDQGAAGRAALHAVTAAHDRHHLWRYQCLGDSWPRRHGRFAPAGEEPAHSFTAERRAQLYALFADLEPPSGAGQVLQLTGAAREMVNESSYSLKQVDPRTWREGAGMLYEPRDGHVPENGVSHDSTLEAVVLYAAMVHGALTESAGGTEHDGRMAYEWYSGCGEDPADPASYFPPPGIPPGGSWHPTRPRPPERDEALVRLRAWIEGASLSFRKEFLRPRVAELLGVRRRAAAARADVRVEIDPDIYGSGGHVWRVALRQDDGEGRQSLAPVAESRAETPPERLEAEIRPALSAALEQGDVDEHLAAVEFLLPRPLFDLPVAEWRTAPPDPADPFNARALPLGQRRLVVIRDRMRKDQGPTPEWRARAKGVTHGPLHAVPLRREVPGHGHDAPFPEGGQAAFGRLQAAPPGAVPVYCSGTGSGAGQLPMAAALTAGHVIALWRHSDHGHEDCAEFHERADELLGEAGAADHLPARVRLLRSASADDEMPDPAAVWARHLAILYDPPEQPPRALGEPPLSNRSST